MRNYLIALLLSLPCLSLADTVSVFFAGDESLTLSYRDDRHIRVDRSSGGYSVINGTRAAAVINQGGNNLVLDMDQIGAMLQGINQQQVKIPAARDVRLLDTGEYRQVAGFQGKLFRVSDGRGVYQVVLSSDPQVIAASDALRHFLRRFASALGNEQGARILALDTTFRDHPYRGLLQVEGGLQLAAIREEFRPDGFYTLPASNLNLALPGLGR